MTFCNGASQHIYQRPDGKWFEVFSLNGQAWENEISGPTGATRTPPEVVLKDWGVCQIAPNSNQESLLLPDTPKDSDLGSLVGVLMLASSAVIVLGLCCFGAMLSYRWMPPRALPGRAPVALPGGGNSSARIPSEPGREFVGNSAEFEGNSDGVAPADSPGIPGGSADSAPWPPKTMGAPYSPTDPEQPGEFDTYRKHVDQDGLSPRGNDIIKAMWGVSPGRSAAYEAAKKRRDEFAKRLNYYRYEEA